MKWLENRDKRYTDNALDEKERHRKIENCKKDRTRQAFLLPFFCFLVIVDIYWGTESGTIWMAIVCLTAWFGYVEKSKELRYLLILDKLIEKGPSMMKNCNADDTAN